jgi:hypothetical protein
MPTIDPVMRFWIGVAVTCAIAISQGTLNLTHAIPNEIIPYVTAWCGIIAFVGSTIITAVTGIGMTTQNRLASAAAIPEVKQIITDNIPMADAAGPKVVAAAGTVDPKAQA